LREVFKQEERTRERKLEGDEEVSLVQLDSAGGFRDKEI